MSTDVFANFSALDELIQVIYQGVEVFTVLSNVSDIDNCWSIHLSSNGRWWKGYWTPRNVLDIIGSSPSSSLLEQFAEKLSETFIQGQICVTGWGTDSPQFTLGPTSKRPMHVSLEEMSMEDGALYAASMFKEIAIQAKSRQCRLHGDSTEPAFTHNTHISPVQSTAPDVSSSPQVGPSSEAKESVIKASPVKQQVPETVKKRPAPESRPVTSKSPPPRPKVAGASLAHPNKKARRFKAVELGSDSDDD
ncbi:hypothetical protein DL96DRAFT_1130058 [Flagelloscypha sp. PMI_526]|nr:hypothetical protein DL96DRAFT_1130058 [Flagelloscypha sp. PMI_526]